MRAEKDYAIHELGRLKLLLRANLRFVPQTIGADTFYVIEDPVNSRFYRVGVAEYAFISLLDGQTEVGDALRIAAGVCPNLSLSEQEAGSICKWLVQSDLAHTAESSQASQLAAKAQTADRTRSRQRWNPIIIRFPLFSPDRFFALLLPWLGWMHAPLALAIGMAISIVSVFCVLLNWNRFASASDGVLAPGNWLWLLLSYLVLKFVHEVSHGITCKKYGGSVREAGKSLTCCRRPSLN